MKRRFPTLAVCAAAAAILVAAAPGWHDVLIYDREAIARGELWRIFTCHWVHFSASHGAWNVFAVIFTGSFLELKSREHSRLFWAVSPWFIGMLLFLVSPGMVSYGGLSGIAVGLVVLGALHAKSKAMAALVLLAVAAKIGVEWGSSMPLIASIDPEVVTSVGSHVGGSICALAVYFGCRSTPRFLETKITKPVYCQGEETGNA